MRLMNVQGVGKITIQPNIVIISFRMKSSCKEYSDTLKVLNHQTESLRKSLDLIGIDRAKLKTTDFEIGTDTKEINNKYVLLGYWASHKLMIELPFEKELLNSVLQQIAKSQSGAGVSIYFSAKDSEKHHKQILIEAVRDAKSKASILAETSGVILGKIQEINYGHTSIHFYDHGISDMECCDGVNADIEPKDITASDTVSLVYEIMD